MDKKIEFEYVSIHHTNKKNNITVTNPSRFCGSGNMNLLRICISILCGSSLKRQKEE